VTVGTGNGSAPSNAWRLPRNFHACYTFPAPQRRFCFCGSRSSWILRVLNSAAAGWRLALRVVACQAIATLATAAVCLMLGWSAALAALAGGGMMTLGSLLAGWGAFGGGVAGAGSALGRLLLGTAAKWLVVGVGLYLAMAVWRLPAMPVLAGAAMAAAAFIVSMKFVVANRSTTRTMA
jgi:F0F1-type ATP synthase assembly protein I